MSKRWLSVRSRSRSTGQSSRLTIQPSSNLDEFQFRQDVYVGNTKDSVSSQEKEKSPPTESFPPTRTETDRPRTAGGIMQSKSYTGIRPDIPTRELHKYESPVPSKSGFSAGGNTYLEASTIGVALGSPTHSPIHRFGITAHPYCVPVGFGGPEEDMDERLKAKSSKWKKFGGFFKGKPVSSNQTLPQPSPLSQFQTQDQWKSKNEPETSSKYPLKTSIEHAQLPTQIMEQPIIHANSDKGFESPATSRRAELPKLDINIPDVTMDRYSVMFGTVIHGQQSANLLARRSKALGKLRTGPNESDSKLLPPAPHFSDGSSLQSGQTDTTMKTHLFVRPKGRRATSPAATPSPIFSLFPLPPSTPRQGSGKTPLPKRSALKRSFTAPSYLSPMRDSFNVQTPQAGMVGVNKRRDSVASPEQTSAATSQGVGWSTDGSFLSPASSKSSFQEEEILFDLKKLSVLADNRQSQYELTQPDGAAIELYRSRSQKQRAAKKSKRKESIENSSTKIDQSSQEVEGLPLLPTSKFTDPALSQKVDSEPPAPLKLEISDNFQDAKPQPLVVKSDNSIPVSRFASSKFTQNPQNMNKLSDIMSVDEVQIDPAQSTGEADQDILAAAVEETLNYMETRNGSRSVTPIPDLPTERPPTPPEKPIKSATSPNRVPISKYSARSPAPPQLRKASSQAEELSQRAAKFSTLNKPQPTHMVRKKVKVVDPKKNTVSEAIPAAAAPLTSGRPAQLHKPRKSTEIAIARKVSLTRKPSHRLIIPATIVTAPAAKQQHQQKPQPLAPKPINSENISSPNNNNPPLEGLGLTLGLSTGDAGERLKLEMNSSQVYTPVIVEAHRGHRPGKSLALVIESV